MRFQRNLFFRLTTPNLPATRLPSPGTKGRFNATVRGNGGQVAICAAL